MKGKDLLLNEGKEKDNGYRCDNIGGGFDGNASVYTEKTLKELKITTSLYSSSAKSHVYKLSGEIKDLIRKDYMDDDLESSKLVYDMTNKLIDEIAKNISSELAKFDKSVKMIIDKAVKKIYKI